MCIAMSIWKLPCTFQDFLVKSKINFSRRNVNFEKFMWCNVLVNFISDATVSIITESNVCTASNDIGIKCNLHKNNNILWTSTWKHFRQDVFIRNLKGNTSSDISVLLVQHCDYQDTGKYTCTWTSNTTYISSSTTITVEGKVKSDTTVPYSWNGAILDLWDKNCIDISYFIFFANVLFLMLFVWFYFIIDLSPTSYFIHIHFDIVCYFICCCFLFILQACQ